MYIRQTCNARVMSTLTAHAHDEEQKKEKTILVFPLFRYVTPQFMMSLVISSHSEAKKIEVECDVSEFAQYMANRNVYKSPRAKKAEK